MNTTNFPSGIYSQRGLPDERIPRDQTSARRRIPQPAAYTASAAVLPRLPRYSAESCSQAQSPIRGDYPPLNSARSAQSLGNLGNADSARQASPTAPSGIDLPVLKALTSPKPRDGASRAALRGQTLELLQQEVLPAALEALNERAAAALAPSGSFYMESEQLDTAHVGFRMETSRDRCRRRMLGLLSTLLPIASTAVPLGIILGVDIPEPYDKWVQSILYLAAGGLNTAAIYCRGVLAREESQVDDTVGSKGCELEKFAKGLKRKNFPMRFLDQTGLLNTIVNRLQNFQMFMNADAQEEYVDPNHSGNHCSLFSSTKLTIEDCNGLYASLSDISPAGTPLMWPEANRRFKVIVAGILWISAKYNFALQKARSLNRPRGEPERVVSVFSGNNSLQFQNSGQSNSRALTSSMAQSQANLPPPLPQTAKAIQRFNDGFAGMLPAAQSAGDAPSAGVRGRERRYLTYPGYENCPIDGDEEEDFPTHSGASWSFRREPREPSAHEDYTESTEEPVEPVIVGDHPLRDLDRQETVDFGRCMGPAGRRSF